MTNKDLELAEPTKILVCIKDVIDDETQDVLFKRGKAYHSRQKTATDYLTEDETDASHWLTFGTIINKKWFDTHFVLLETLDVFKVLELYESHNEHTSKAYKERHRLNIYD